MEAQTQTCIRFPGDFDAIHDLPTPCDIVPLYSGAFNNSRESMLHVLCAVQ